MSNAKQKPTLVLLPGDKITPETLDKMFQALTGCGPASSEEMAHLRSILNEGEVGGQPAKESSGDETKK
jgi:hypothetical protein